MKFVMSKEKDFLKIINLIQKAKEKALLAVNTELIRSFLKTNLLVPSQPLVYDRNEL